MADFSDFALRVGEYNSSLPTLTDGSKNELQLDSSGRLIISGRYLEDSAHSSGDAGLSMLAVRNDAGGSLVDTDGDYAPLQVDSEGRLIVNAQITVDIGAEKAEDAAHASGDTGNYILAVRADSRPTNANTDADGDYASIFVNANGELYVHDTDALSKLTEIDAVLDNIYIDTQAISTDVAAIETELLDQGTSLDNIETDISDLKKAEDSAHSSGDYGAMFLGVRNDADSDLTDADGDYSPISVDSKGRIKSVIELSGSEAYSVTDDLGDNLDGLETITASGTPWVTVSSLAVGAGTTAKIYGYSWACDQNAAMRIITDDTSVIKVYKVGVNSSAKPGESEHFASEGYIEIAGAANLEIKLQIKKRSATQGDAQGTGSIHIRTE